MAVQSPRLANTPGRKAMPAVEVPSTKSASVSLALRRPNRRWMTIEDDSSERARDEREREDQERSRDVPSRRCFERERRPPGNTSTEAMP
jgi:hypothetical protein